MKVVDWIVLVVFTAILLSVVTVVNRPLQAPDWPATIQGMSFSPFRIHQSPQKGHYPTTTQITDDLQLLSGKVHTIRTYSVADSLGLIPTLAEPFAINVHVGVWLSGDSKLDEQEIARFSELFPGYGNNVTAVIVGNETLLRGELTAYQLSQYIDEIRRITQGRVPITTAETWDNWLASPRLAQQVDFVSIHILPYWEGVSVDQAPDYVMKRFNEVKANFSQTPVMLGEVGWPSAGRQRGGAIPSQQNQATFLREFLSLAEQQDVNYFLIEAFDQVWKVDEGAVGRYWGIYDVERQAKFSFDEPIARIQYGYTGVLLSCLLAILVLSLILRDSKNLNLRGRAFLVLVAGLVATSLVFLVLSYHQQYLNWEHYLIGSALLVAIVFVACVLMVEALEWAETLWGKTQIRIPSKHADKQQRWPKVSLHLATYNEPADMVLLTLEALNRLDYPELEVIVVDNNTPDAAVWEPLLRWCESHAERFHFFHVNPLPGFKAGALNYALSHTASDADIIAVIDSDYLVSPNWLRQCIPLFNDTGVAIVQAPQDYRDSHRNAFKAMLYDEYAAFFGVGMLNRHARNAIIQHGTMTLVRRSTLESVGRWSEWCITEDAELGLRVLANGFRAVYVPQSYGRGLVPDTFIDFKKQRFRWAYGSATLLRQYPKDFLVCRVKDSLAVSAFIF